MTNTVSGRCQWNERKAAVAAGKPNAYAYFKNIAVTTDDELCVGMVYSAEWRRYSCSAVITDGVRINHPRRWDQHGGSMDGTSDLDMTTINDGISKN